MALKRQNLLALLKVRPDEARMAFGVALFFAVIELGRGIGGSAADALFFRRFGVEYLPYLFIGLGITTFIVSLSYAAFLGRVAKRRLFSTLLLSMVLILLAERAAIRLDLPALYPLLWLSVNLIGSLLGTMAWTTAGEVCDTRQAKRLFPIFVSASVLGGLVGSLVIGPLARLFGTDNLLVMYGLLLALALVLIRDIAQSHFRVADQSSESASFLADIRTGYDYVRRSPLLQRIAISAVLFSILYFSVSFPFGRAVSASFTSEADLAGFLGLFNGIASVLMFVAALLVANRLYARIGIVNALLILPITYLFGFVLLAVHFSLSSAIVVRLSQLAVMSGIGEGAYSAFFNVVPLEKRAQVRAFDSGVPSQIGTILSGILLILGERILGNSDIFLMGVAVALACAYVVWRMRQSYVAALVAALRAGRIDVFTAGERNFAGFQQDANALRIVIAALDDPKPTTQQLAAEVLARMDALAAAPQLIRRLGTATPDVKVAFVRALAELGAGEAAAPVAALLSDPSPEVRKAALEALPKLHAERDGAIRRLVQPLLADADFAVRAQVLVSLAVYEDDEAAAQSLVDMLHASAFEHRLIVLRALKAVLGVASSRPGRQRESAVEAVVGCLEDESAAVREAACVALRGAISEQALSALAGRLSDPEQSVRTAAAYSLRTAGAQATSLVLAVLGAILTADHDAALDALSPDDPAIYEPLRSFAWTALNDLKQGRMLLAAVPTVGRVTRFLAWVLEAKAAEHEQRLVKVLGLLGNSDAMTLVARSIHTEDTKTRSAALEALDVLGDKQLVKAFLPLLEYTPRNQGHDPSNGELLEAVFHQLISHQERWVQALAIRAVGELGLRAMVPDLHRFAVNSDRVIGDAARDALLQLGEKMEALTTMSLMERILLLKEVPLFHDLSSDDLGRIADIASERWFPDGEPLCREGENGDELFIVASGRVRVTKETDKRERLLATRGVGEFIGEMAIIESIPRFATVRADGEARTLVIGSNAFRAILRDRPEVSLAVMRALSRRLRERE